VGGSAHPLPFVALSCGDAPLLRWLGQITGVRSVVTERKFDRHRCLEHCDKAHDHVTSVSGRWQLSGVRATVVLTACVEWVKFHRERWERAIEVGLEAPRKEGTVKKMEALGWPLPWTQ